MKSKKRITLLAVLVCVFALVLSLGILGACGNDGENGGTATAGGSYLYGTTAPDEGLGKAGDYYLDTETLSAYVKTADGEWVQTALYSGTGAPDANAEALKDAAAGDLYLDTAGGVLYQKGESLWSIVLKVKGRDGVVWFSGTEEDPNKLNGETLLQGAMKGDFYLDTTNFVVWQLGEDGQWNWLGSIKGDKGDDSVHVFYGTGVPEGNSSVEGAVDGDLYFGTFDGLDGKGSGIVLYRYNKDGSTWEELMSSLQDGVEIRTVEQLFKFAQNVNGGTDYEGKNVRLKADIDLSEALAKVSVFETIENTWTPIGTSDAPFKGTFDGEGHTISNLTAAAAGTNGRAGFFGYVDGATIEHLKFSNAQIEATDGAAGGILAGEAKGLTVSDVVIENSAVENAAAGTKDSTVVQSGLIGNFAEGASEEDFRIEDTTVRETDEDGIEKETTWGGASPEGESAAPKTIFTVWTAEEFQKALSTIPKSGTVALGGSIDFTDAESSGLTLLHTGITIDMDGNTVTGAALTVGQRHEDSSMEKINASVTVMNGTFVTSNLDVEASSSVDFRKVDFKPAEGEFTKTTIKFWPGSYHSGAKDSDAECFGKDHSEDTLSAAFTDCYFTGISFESASYKDNYYRDSDIDFTRCTFDNEEQPMTALQFGYMYGGTIDIADCTFKAGSPTSNGYSFVGYDRDYLNGVTINITGSTFTAGIMEGNASCLLILGRLTNCNVTIDGCSFSAVLGKGNSSGIIGIGTYDDGNTFINTQTTVAIKKTDFTCTLGTGNSQYVISEAGTQRKNLAITLEQITVHGLQDKTDKFIFGKTNNVTIEGLDGVTFQ